MNQYKERQKIVEEIMTTALAKTLDRRYRSYLYTKKFCYLAISRFFIGEHVLELGCDESPTTSILVRWSKRLTVVDRVDKLSPKISDDPLLLSLEFIQSNWEDFYPESRFSDIVLTDGLEHVDEPVQILERMKKFLAPGGRIHVVVPNALSIHRLLGVNMGLLSSPYALNENDLYSGHKTVYDVTKLTSDVLKAGIATLTIEGIQLKPMSDTQLSQFPAEYLEALNQLSYLFPTHCAEIYVCGTHC
ncbi:MAG: class I SAM-dependent methyltransferase [Deltaproteobacteria bacterium]|nr:class I SAM-dependent methyltransferase [Deltaproteobacteria bacterium]